MKSINYDPDLLAQKALNEYRSELLKDHYNNNSSKSLLFDTDIDYDIINDVLFDCNFESGNIGDIIKTKNNEYDIQIRGDNANKKHSIWFYFRIKNAIKSQNIILHIYGYSKGKSQLSEGFTPVIRSKTKPMWIRMPNENINWFKCNKHKNNCFTISIAFETNNDEYYIAYSYPYTYTYLQKFLIEIENLKLPYVKRYLLARTVQQRRLDCIRIDDTKNDENNLEKHVIVISARVHPVCIYIYCIFLFCLQTYIIYI